MVDCALSYPPMSAIESKTIFTIQTKNTMNIRAGIHNAQLGILLMIDFFFIRQSPFFSTPILMLFSNDRVLEDEKDLRKPRFMMSPPGLPKILAYSFIRMLLQNRSIYMAGQNQPLTRFLSFLSE